MKKLDKSFKKQYNKRTKKHNHIHTPSTQLSTKIDWHISL